MEETAPLGILFYWLTESAARTVPIKTVAAALLSGQEVTAYPGRITQLCHSPMPPQQLFFPGLVCSGMWQRRWGGGASWKALSHSP